jgi:hypothetical protein
MSSEVEESSSMEIVGTWTIIEKHSSLDVAED